MNPPDSYLYFLPPSFGCFVSLLSMGPVGVILHRCVSTVILHRSLSFLPLSLSLSLPFLLSSLILVFSLFIPLFCSLHPSSVKFILHLWFSVSTLFLLPPSLHFAALAASSPSASCPHIPYVLLPAPPSLLSFSLKLLYA